MTSASRDPLMAARPARTEAQIGDVHEDDVEYAPASHGFEFGLCLLSPDLGSGMQGRSG